MVKSKKPKQQQKLSEHHRKPRSLGGMTIPKNISRVSIKQHESWHCLFENYPPDKICEIINAIWLDPDYKFVCIKKSK